MINEHAEQGRVIVAILVSTLSLAVHIAMRPVKKCAHDELFWHHLLYRMCVTAFTSRTHRPEDGALMFITELALIVVYVCILLIKTCNSERSSSSNSARHTSFHGRV